MQPVIEGMMLYTDLIDGSVDICDVALCNDSLAVRADNEAIMREQKED
jgi:hypothetical protein